MGFKDLEKRVQDYRKAEEDKNKACELQPELTSVEDEDSVE
ncbi:hypothetical protein SAMN05660649_01453 [Desulfotomaculum arcticum]|uniref:Uncharacterized protein n=1 Tax=Desulfotruncus arcticus DSM 17038 TaxID=1121424 RepID=A0A1I2REL6_9FIRM|nr:hypothetical protein [Desulfotruncus arcticus]SFG37047.1 hypothetical protein SAMN05660649_01453 [Desulfotomaculum arcticum] [Desulfotruncus arcticus DSM 17038]